MQVASDLLQTKYHFDKVTAGYLFGIPYIIGAIFAPPLGLMIDKYGRRAFLCCLSSVILLVAFTLSMFATECDKCHKELLSLVLIGLGWTIYAAAIWGTIPLVVAPHTVGTAFGMVVSIQNLGLVMAPTIVGIIKDKTREIVHGYFWVFAFFIAINLVGLAMNVALYQIDLKENNGRLNKVYIDSPEN